MFLFCSPISCSRAGRTAGFVKMVFAMSELGLIVYCGTVPSTQDLAREILQSPPVLIRAVVAEHQTAGRGRHGNRWLDTPGESLLMTLLLRLQTHEVERAGQLAFVMALAVADALRGQTGLEAGFKWSNDVLVNGRKIAGILIETAYDAHRNPWALAGVGVNLLQKEFPEEIRGKATSVWLETGQLPAVELLAQELLASADRWMQAWREKGFTHIINAWRQHDTTAGHLYRLPSGEVATAQGVTDEGMVILRKGSDVLTVSTAEPVWGIYGTADE